MAPRPRLGGAHGAAAGGSGGDERPSSAARLRLRRGAAGGLAWGGHGGARPRGRLPLRILDGTAGVAHDLLAADNAFNLVNAQRLELEEIGRAACRERG